MTKELHGASLFTGAAIGDLGFRAAGIDFVAMSELEEDRAALAQLNFPTSTFFVGDINHNVEQIQSHLSNCFDEIFLMTCTAPCQGMSKSGQGTLLKNIRAGKRPKLDPRNRLILPALQVLKEIQPRWIVFENVLEMRDTLIEDSDGALRPILDIIADTLSPDYRGMAYDVEFADYGLAQRRQRLITIYTRDESIMELLEDDISLIPLPTHAENPTNGQLPWVSVEEALRGFPELDAGNKKTAEDPRVLFHRVPLLDSRKYEWVRHTPVSSTAFDNQCVAPQCGYQNNQTHGAQKNHEGINRARHDTPLYCQRCGELLPRPHTVEADGGLRIMRGYTSAYKRMDPNLPAPALTRNLSYACSDNKLHPFQNRVLSLAEAMHLQTISDYDFNWGPIQVRRRGSRTVLPTASDTLIRLVIGESVPPRFLELLGRHLRNLTNDFAYRASVVSDAGTRNEQYALL